jgi:TRAP-type C4-dicarboxylate transport system permease small subunit
MGKEPKVGNFAKFAKFMSLWAGRVSGYLILAMIFATGFEVVARYLLNRPTSWANEICTYLLLISALLGMAYTQDVKGHISVDWITSNLPLKAQRYLDLFGLAASLIFWGLLCWQGILLSVKGWSWQSQTILEFPLIYSLIAIPLGSFLMCLQLVADFYEHFLHCDPLAAEIAGHGSDLEETH